MVKKLFLLFPLFITGQACLSQVESSGRIALLADNKNSVTVFHDEPVIFSVTLTNPGSRFAQDWNIASERDIAKLKERMKNDTSRKEKYTKEIGQLEAAKKEVPTFKIGTKQQPWFTMIKWEIIPVTPATTPFSLPVFLTYPQTDTVAVLDAGSYYKAFYGISESEMQKWKAGKYRLRAVCEKMVSEPFELTVKAQGMSSIEAESIQMLFKKGRYYWLSGNPGMAIQSVQKIIVKNPALTDAFVFRGEIFVQKMDYAAALKDFTEALKLLSMQHPVQSEPPEYLLGMIAWLKEQQ